MKVNCYIRQTKEWAEHYAFANDIYLNIWKANHIAKTWDNTFNTSYKNFRKQLNLIQQENLREVKFDKIVNQYEYIDEDAITVPTDDDDWFHPNVMLTLKGVGRPVMLWNFINYNQGIVSVHNPYYQQFQFESNNYALIQPRDKEQLKDHVHADKTLKNKGLYINEYLSMHNRSMASLSVLRPLYERGNFKCELLNLYDVYRRPVEVPKDVPSYFIKYIDKMFHIYSKELKVRKMFA